MKRLCSCIPQLTLIACLPRQAALEVLKTAAACIKTTEAVKAEVAKVQKILDGSAEGRVKNATERSALVASLSAFCACPCADAAMQELAEESAEFLANYYKYVPRPSCLYVHVLHLGALLTSSLICQGGQ